jgi:transcriptional regulator NrdR family protein
MNKWMDEFKFDSAVNDVKERINYLGEEKLKVTKVKEAILNGLQKADSVLKEKF